MPPSSALLGGFAIGARVALLWQHNANAKCQRVHACTRSMPNLDLVVIRIQISAIRQPQNWHNELRGLTRKSDTEIGRVAIFKLHKLR